MKPQNPPAFPTTKPLDGWGDPDKGMTLRDYFAAKAMQGMFNEAMIRVSNDVIKSGGKGRADWFAEQAYNFADAMLKQREL